MRARDFLALDCFLGAELTGAQELQVRVVISNSSGRLSRGIDFQKEGFFPFIFKEDPVGLR